MFLTRDPSACGAVQVGFKAKQAGKGHVRTERGEGLAMLELNPALMGRAVPTSRRGLGQDETSLSAALRGCMLCLGKAQHVLL